MLFDLHTHTTFSDGTFSPKELVSLAYKKGLKGIAITDHDNISGIEIAIQSSKAFENFTVIPGIEFSCVYKDEEVHILGYFINYTSSAINKISNKLQKSRVERGLNIIDKLKGIGIDIPSDQLNLILPSDNYIGRPHIARALVQRGYAKTVQEAFDLYLARGKPAYVERYKLDIGDTIDLIHESGGLAVVAHPGLLKQKTIIKHCINLGIDGIEAVHPKHTKQDVLYLLSLAKEYKLFFTGGSDFHGDKVNGKLLLGQYYINLSDIPELKERI